MKNDQKKEPRLGVDSFCFALFGDLWYIGNMEIDYEKFKGEALKYYFVIA